MSCRRNAHPCFVHQARLHLCDSIFLCWCSQKSLVDGRMVITAASITPADSREPLSIFHEQGVSPSSLPQVGVHPIASSRTFPGTSVMSMRSRGLLVGPDTTASECTASFCKHAEAVQQPETRDEHRALTFDLSSNCYTGCRPSNRQQSPGLRQQWYSWWSICRTWSRTRCLSS